MAKERLSALTGVRFLAALMVLLYHLFRHDPGIPTAIRAVIGKGYMGVGLFFILSGFVLGYNYVSPEGRLAVSLRQFYSARFARVYPNYLLAFLLFAPVMWVNPALKQGQLALTGVTTVTLTQACFNLIQWNVPAWSLSNEAFFYAAFPLLILLLRHTGARWWPMLLIGMWALALLAPTVYALRPLPQSSEDIVRFNPLARIPEFILGLILARIFAQPEPEIQRRALRLLKAAAIIPIVWITVVCVTDNSIPRVFYHNGLLDPVWALAIYSLAARKTCWVSRWLSVQWMVLLGESSYALYILQSPVLILMKGAWAVLVYGSLSLSGRTSDDRLFTAVYGVSMIVVSVLIFRYFEMPTRHRLNDWLRRWSRGKAAYAAR